MTQIGSDVLKNNLGSVARIYEWDFEIPAPPAASSGDVWFVRAQTAIIPGKEFEDIHIDYKATGGFNVPGREKYSHEFPVTLIESQDSLTFQAINNWQDMIVDATDGTGTPDNDLKTDAIIMLQDESDNNWMTIQIVGIYPKRVGDVKLTYGEPGAIKYDVVFSYDRWIVLNTANS
jgi:hypothetical protein